MTEAEKNRIDAMSQEEMARLWRYAPPGAWPFNDDCFEYFKDSFTLKGGTSVEISKKIGWDK